MRPYASRINDEPQRVHAISANSVINFQYNTNVKAIVVIRRPDVDLYSYDYYV